MSQSYEDGRKRKVDYHLHIVLKLELSSIHIPINAIMCTDVSCSDNDYFESINNYVECISNACLRAAECTVPHTRARGNRGSIPGWTELVAPYRSNSLFGIICG